MDETQTIRHLGTRIDQLEQILEEIRELRAKTDGLDEARASASWHIRECMSHLRSYVKQAQEPAEQSAPLV